MLYLAEVQKKSGGVFGGGTKAELKLLACQRGEQNWSAVPGDEVIAAPTEEANKYADGALVLVELTSNRHIQRIDAGRQLVGILQNFSRQQEKYKNKEEEIEQWKESLTYQAQELNRREMEIQARQEELAQMEDEFERLEQQRQEISSSREETEQLREEIERNRQELEGAWEHLRGEMNRLEERQTDFQQRAAAVLDDQQASRIRDLMNGLSESVISVEPIQEHLNLAFEIVNVQQNTLNQYWQQLEQKRASAQQLQGEVDRQTENFQNRWTLWQQAQDSLAQARSEFKAQQHALAIKQEYAQTLNLQVRTQEDWLQQVQRLAALSADVKISSQQVDTEALERMPLGDLQAVVQDLQQELEKFKGFVTYQENDLTDQRQVVEELRQKIQQASTYDRATLERELADEQDRYQMLEESLVGQRRTLREREETLSQHQRVLRRRQGMPDEGGDNLKLDMGPILSQLEVSRQQQTEELQKLDREIEQMRSSIQQAQGMIDPQTQEQEHQRQELKQLEQSLQSQRAEVAELWGRVRLYEEMLQPHQDKLNELRQKLEAIAGTLNQIQESGNYQHRAVAEMRQILVSLMSNQTQPVAFS